MSSKRSTQEKNLILISGRAHPELAEEVAQELGVTLTKTTMRNFANGEIFVRYEESVRGTDAFVIQSFPAPLNEWLVELLIMIDALKLPTTSPPFSPSTPMPVRTRSTWVASLSLLVSLRIF